MSNLGNVAQTEAGACIVKERLAARAIKRILNRQSREVVGWLYEWNTGEQGPMWKNGRCQDIIYE